MDLHLNNKRALVSGSTAGIGFAIASLLAQEGAEVIVNGRTEERVASAIEQISKDVLNAKLTGIAADLGTVAGAEVLFAKVPEVDILVNNLGIYQIKDFADITDEDWQHILEVNVLSGVRLSHRYLGRMLANNWGRIIFISSESGVNIPVEMVHYGVTKTAQIALARGLAETTAGTGVTVNSVLPGPTRSEGIEGFVKDAAKAQGVDEAQIEQDFFKTLRPSSLIKRFATSEEVASLVAYIASPLAAATNGAALRVEGGLLRSIV
jgi:NAD(P)-dependent dehydrogenase (short-subunit alcohol dehydrogenase family)